MGVGLIWTGCLFNSIHLIISRVHLLWYFRPRAKVVRVYRDCCWWDCCFVLCVGKKSSVWKRRGFVRACVRVCVCGGKVAHKAAGATPPLNLLHSMEGGPWRLTEVPNNTIIRGTLFSDQYDQCPPDKISVSAYPLRNSKTLTRVKVRLCSGGPHPCNPTLHSFRRQRITMCLWWMYRYFMWRFHLENYVCADRNISSGMILLQKVIRHWLQ